MTKKKTKIPQQGINTLPYTYSHSSLDLYDYAEMYCQKKKKKKKKWLS